MTATLPSRPRLGRQDLLSDQIYRRLCPTYPKGCRRAVPLISMEAPEQFMIEFGNGYFLFDEAPPRWFMPILRKLCQLGDLPSNWNSYGASAIDPQIAAFGGTLALALLNERDSLPEVVPTSRGGVMFEWHENGVDLEIDVRSPSKVHIAFESGDIEEDFETEDFEQITKRLNALRKR
jgi:hypothetical protein